MTEHGPEPEDGGNARGGDLPSPSALDAPVETERRTGLIIGLAAGCAVLALALVLVLGLYLGSRSTTDGAGEAAPAAPATVPVTAQDTGPAAGSVPPEGGSGSTVRPTSTTSLDAQTAEDRYLEAARKAGIYNHLSDSELIAEAGDVCAFIPSAADAVRSNSYDTILEVFSGNVEDAGELFLQYLDAVTIICPRNVANVSVIRGYFTAPATTTTPLVDSGALGTMIEDANARAEPSTNSAVSNRIAAGDQVTVTCEKEGDLVTDADNGKSSSRWYFVPRAGYVSSLYVNLPTDFLATCDF